MNDARQDLYESEVERATIWKVNYVHSERGTKPRHVIVPGAFSESFYQNVVIKSVAVIQNGYSKIKPHSKEDQ